MRLLTLAIITPLIAAAGARLVALSGDPVISNFDIARFVLSPAGVGFVLVTAVLLLAPLLAEFAGHTWIAGNRLAGHRVTLGSTFATILRLLPQLMRLALRVFVRLLLLAVPFVACLAILWFATLAGHDINYYLIDEPLEWRRAVSAVKVLAVGYALLAVWQLARWIFAVPMLVLEGQSAPMALRDSATLTRGRVRSISIPLVLYWAAVTVVWLACVALGRFVADAGLDWAGIDIRRVLPLVSIYLVVSLAGTLLFGAVWITGHQFRVTRLYMDTRSKPDLPVLTAPAAAPRDAVRLGRAALAIPVVLLAIAAGGSWLVASRIDPDPLVAITAHRGGIVAAPENTLTALRAAMEAGADYAEIDVQRTRDGEIIVLHDADFMRMADDRRRVRDLTAAEIAMIDVGRKRGAEFSGEKSPTLAQAIGLVRGRMKLNIELKYNVRDAELAPAVIALLRRERFLGDAVITSLDYRALQQVKALEPGMRTGHVVTAAVGNVLRTDADFLSLNSARVSASLVRRAHAAGKEVHAWTINRPEVVLHMIERGVDNVITDDPALVARVLAARSTLDRAELLGLRLRVIFDIPPRELTDPGAVTPL